MTVYAEFTAEEQRLLTQSIAAAATVVSVASPGSRADLVSEGFAAAEFVLDSLRTHVDNTLVSSVIVAIKDRIAADQPFPDYTEVAKAEDAGARARAILVAVAGLLDSRATADEAAGYKRWLLEVADATARGALEDKGFLGFGGVQVNDAERAAIAEVGHLLGLTA